MAGRDVDKPREPALEPAVVLRPEQIVQKTRTALNPLDWAQPSSVSMRPGSKVSAWNISSWLMALDVM